MMADSTVNYGFPYPEGSDAVVVHSDVRRLAQSVDAQALQTNVRVDSAIPFRGNLDEQTGTLATLPEGRYLVRYTGTATAWGLPQALIGMLEVLYAGGQKKIIYSPNDSASGNTVTATWELATNSSGVLRDRWQRNEKTIMRSSPVVLTAPAGEYGPVANSRGAVRIPFTVPTNVSKVRVHMRPWNYRTGATWGPANLRGVMIAQQASSGSGSVTGGRWYAPGADGATVPGGGWTSEWFNVGMGPDTTYLLSYGADWQDTSRDLVLGTCWASFNTDEWDTPDPVSFQTGWGGFFLQPMDIWIECEAPAIVPVWSYYGASNTMGMDSGDPVFGAYPTLHARKAGAFCALTAAGGWSIMDATAHQQSVVRRLGLARLSSRVYLDWGSNIAARGATAEEAMTELERWMNVQLPGLSTAAMPDVFLLTQVAAPGITETTDLSGTLSTWNEWIRYTLSQRPEVKGVSDIASVTADPATPWTARPELRASPGNVHFNGLGQVIRARALEGEIQLPFSDARNPDEMPGGGPVVVDYVGDGVYSIT